MIKIIQFNIHWQNCMDPGKLVMINDMKSQIRDLYNKHYESKSINCIANKD